jgi:hypothetical protein
MLALRFIAVFPAAGWVAVGTPVIASGGLLGLRHPDAAGDSRRYSYRVLVGD